jgi:hypothetical protein
MIIRSLSRKSISFKQALMYFNAPDLVGEPLTHNLLSDADDLSGIHEEFLDNARYLAPRKNGNVLFHEIVSFGAKDKHLVTPAVVEDLIRRYLELRAPRALAYALSHKGGACAHVHILISANNVQNARRARLTRSQFDHVKKKLELYQRQRYPELEHSIAQEVKKRKARQGRAESELHRRLRKQGNRELSRKEMLRERLIEQIKAARSEEGFLMRLELLGQRFYRRGRHAGVIDKHTGRRHRLRTLGVEETFEEHVMLWARTAERQKAIEQVSLEKMRAKWLEVESRGDLLMALSHENGIEGMSDREIACLKEIARVMQVRQR